MPATTAQTPGALHPHDRERVSNPVVAVVRRHPIAAYYILAFAISWGAILVAVGPDGFLATGNTIAVAGSVSLLGPTMAGILVTTLTDGTAGLRRLASRLRHWRVAARWYAFALLTGPLVMAITVTAFSLASTKFRPDIATADNKASIVIAGIAGGIAIGVFEELGWTGVALPRLRARFGVPATGLLMGLLWSVWHFPLFAGTTDPEGTVPRILLVVVLLFAWLPPYRLLMVWLYDRTDSLPLAMLMHVPIAAGALVLATEDASGTATLIQVLAWGAIYWAIVGVVVWANAGHLTRGQDRVPAGPPGSPRELGTWADAGDRT